MSRDEIDAELASAAASLHPRHADAFERIRCVPRLTQVGDSPGERVWVVAQHGGSVVYYSDIEAGWAVALASMTGIPRRDSSQWDLAHVLSHLFGDPEAAQGLPTHLDVMPTLRAAVQSKRRWPTCAGASPLGPQAQGVAWTVTTEPEPKSTGRMGTIVLWVAVLGCLTLPIGVLLLAFSFLVSLVMVLADSRDGRRLSRGAVAALILCVVWPPFYLGLLPRLVYGP